MRLACWGIRRRISSKIKAVLDQAQITKSPWAIISQVHHWIARISLRQAHIIMRLQGRRKSSNTIQLPRWHIPHWHREQQLQHHSHSSHHISKASSIPRSSSNTPTTLIRQSPRSATRRITCSNSVVLQRTTITLLKLQVISSLSNRITSQFLTCLHLMDDIESPLRARHHHLCLTHCSSHWETTPPLHQDLLLSSSKSSCNNNSSFSCSSSNRRPNCNSSNNHLIRMHRTVLQQKFNFSLWMLLICNSIKPERNHSRLI